MSMICDVMEAPCAHAPGEAFSRDVLAGLSGSPRHIPSLYFYDKRGSRLFQQITELDEYYLTRCEQEILETYAERIVATLSSRRVRIVDAGAGDGHKTEVLLRAMLDAGHDFEYVPIDICRQAVVSLASPQERKSRLVLWETDQSIVIMNKYPYTNGHLLVAPRTHVSSLEDLSQDQLVDLQIQTTKALKLLKKTMSPQGFNIGINLGHCAGAGLPGHLHQHIVPRWGGDVNFMAVVGHVRVIPASLEAMAGRFRGARERMRAAAAERGAES